MGSVIIRYYDSPAGILILGAYGDRLCLCDWMEKERRERIDKRMRQLLDAKYELGESEVTNLAAKQLDEYFERRRTEFDVPMLMAGTAFQQSVWHELQHIPYGDTISYGTLADRIGNPKAVRAVATANRANPISILVPCHRVVGSNHRLVGYGGGLAVKKMLIELERK